MEAIPVIDVDQEEDEDWEIGLFHFSRQTLPPTPFDCNDDDDDDYDEGEFQDFDDDYDGKAELGCPYCAENFDILALCCHIDDQHYKDAKSGICPICDKTLDANMTVHIIAEHKSMLRSLRKVKVRSGGTDTGLSKLKIEDRFCSLPKVSSPVGSPELPPDPSFLSFVRTSMPACRPGRVQPESPSEATSSSTTSNCDTEERSINPSSLADKSQDKVKVCEFVSDLLFSTI